MIGVRLERQDPVLYQEVGHALHALSRHPHPAGDLRHGAFPFLHGSNHLPACLGLTDRRRQPRPVTQERPIEAEDLEHEVPKRGRALC